MSKLVIGNSFNDYLVADLERFDPVERQIGGNISLRLVWLAEPGDIVVLPQDADPAFISYVTRFKGLPEGCISVLVPPPGRFGRDVLTRDRMTEPGFQAELRRKAAAHGVTSLLPYVFDSTVSQLGRDLGLDAAMPGFGFLSEGGADLLNSKAAFRSLAAGNGVPIAPGVVTVSRAAAESFAREMFGLGHPVIVKQDFHQGGHGNEILSPVRGIAQIGAAAMTVAKSTTALRAHFDRRWDFYSNAGRSKVVLERYLPDSVPIGAEVEITSSKPSVRHIGEMRMTPVFDGVVLPGITMTSGQRHLFRVAVLALCAAVRAIGYRGLINVDGIITPDGHVLLTEYNGRLGGTTHLHWLGESAIGKDYTRHRVFLSNNDWKVPSLTAALDRISAEGLAFVRPRRSGVVVSCDHTRQSGAVEYCVIAPDLAAARELETAVKTMFLPGVTDVD